MSEVLAPAAYVYEGFWTDWTKGALRGLTVTLCPTHSTLLTNSLALFVTLAGGQLWTIVRFALHQSRPYLEKSDIQHSQQQVVLRNATTDLSTVRLMSIIAWKTLHQPRNRSYRAIFISLLALFHAVLFMAAGTLSNNFISSSNSAKDPSLVLSRSSHCGSWNQTYYEIAAGARNNPESSATLSLSTQYFSKLADNVQQSVDYALECYMSQPVPYMSSTCSTLKASRLNWTTVEGSCPFNSRICHKDANTIVIETDVIDSHLDLGINSKAEDRLTYRRRTNCTVLNSTNYVTGWESDPEIDDPNSSRQTTYAFFGPSNNKQTNWTYSYSNFESLYDNFTAQVMLPYQIDAEMSFGPADPQWSSNDFDVIPDLAQDSADVVLIFLSYTGMYTQEINDPWFLARQIHHFDSPYLVLRTRYTRDHVISTLGCTEQHQFCLKDGNCTPFLGNDQVQNVASFNSALNEHQNFTFNRMAIAIPESSIGRLITRLTARSTPLLATNATAIGTFPLSLPLPTNQWESELKYWHSIAMAQFQRTIYQWGTGQIAPTPLPGEGPYIVKPQTKAESWFCSNLLIPSTGYQSFSVAAIIVMIVLGTAIITVSLTIENLAGCVQRRFSKAAVPLRAWEADDMLKLSSQDNWKPLPPPKDKFPSTTARREPGGTAGLRQVLPSECDRRYTGHQSNGRRPSSETIPLEDLAFLHSQPRNFVPV